MRLIHLADYGGSYPGSFIPMVRAVLERARGRGWEVEAVFSEVARERDWLGELRAEGYACSTAPAGRRELARTVARLATRGEPVILHTHFTAFDLAAARAARRDGAVIAYWHLHSELRPGAWWRGRNAIKFGLLSRSIEEILCVAPNILDQAKGRLAPRDRVALVPNAIDLARFPLVTPARRRTARAALGLPSEAPVLLHFGWDWQRKGGDVFLGAVASLGRRERWSGLVAVTVADREPAQTLARSLAVEDRVRVVAPSDNVAELYAAADVFVAPSRGEGHPFAVAEALASGLPVVASPLAGHELIARGTSGCQIVALASEPFAAAVDALLSRSVAEREQIGAQARRWVVEEMDLGAWSERMLARYDRALARRGTLAPVGAV